MYWFEFCRVAQAGDVFQVVLSRRLDIPFTGPPLELYRTLRVVNPSPFMFFLRTPDACTLVGSSPEIMVRVVDDDGHRAAARRHPAPRANARGGSRARRGRCSPTRRNGPST
jgi:anthranilate synthase component 1